MKKPLFMGLVLLALSFCHSISFADDIESRLKAMEELLIKQQKTIEDQQKMIGTLKEEVTSLKEKDHLVKRDDEKIPSPVATVNAQQSPAGSGLTGLFGGSLLSNPYISAVLNTFYYSTSMSEQQLKRGIPGYSILGSEYTKGFNLESMELFLFAPVDPYFNLYATIPIKEDGVELEEAYFLTTGLPEGFQIKGGKFKSAFGRINQQHPHAWDFVDIPLNYRAFTGNEGIIEKGVQFTYLPEFPVYTLVGMEVLQGQNEVLFDPNATNGPNAYSAFMKASFDLDPHSTLLVGPSLVWGKTLTDTVVAGGVFRGNSRLANVELTYKWRPSKRKGFTFQSEYMFRNQTGDLYDVVTGRLSSLTRTQDGLYAQALYQHDRWRLGARYDVLSLFQDTYDLEGRQINFGPRPWRLTGALEFNHSEFSSHEVFFQAVLGIGAHAAHPF
jgi:hypothetical protein